MAEDFSDWIGTSRTVEDLIEPSRTNALLGALGRNEVLRQGDELPALHHWLYFWDVQPPAGLGPDGHPAKGGFLPPIPLPRRMWAGGRLSFKRRLKLGDTIEKTSTIVRIERKDGRSGPLVFVTLEHRLDSGGETAIIEEQDLVYREPADTGMAPLPQPLADLPDCEHHEVVDPDSVLLFRYSALTMNGHRIHYDRPYAIGEEAYPALVVHGPLQATLLADLARRALGRPLKTFDFRGQSPAFDGFPLHVCANTNDDQVSAWTQQGEAKAMVATAS